MREDDLWIVLYPKTASTWPGPLSWSGLRFRCCRLQLSYALRCVFLPQAILEKCKVTYAGKNPKDIALSFYHMALNSPILAYKGTANSDLSMDSTYLALLLYLSIKVIPLHCVHPPRLDTILQLSIVYLGLMKNKTAFA